MNEKDSMVKLSEVNYLKLLPLSVDTFSPRQPPLYKKPIIRRTKNSDPAIIPANMPT